MNNLNRTKNTHRNIFWGLLGRAVTAIGPFIVRAVLIRRLGAEYLGISSLFTSILQVLSLAELGFSSAVVFGMYRPIAEGDVRGVAAYLNYFRRVYRIIGSVIMLFGLALIPFLRLFIKGSTPPEVDIRIAFLIYLINTALSYFLFAYKQALLTAYQRSDLISKATMFISALQCVLQVGVLFIVRNYYAYAIVLPACTVLSNLAINWVAVREMPEFSESSLRQERLSQELRDDMRKRIFGVMVSKVCGVTRNSLDSIVISAFVGLKAVAAYGNYLTIMTGVQSVLGIAGISMVAAVGNSIVKESKEKNFRDLRLFVFIYSIASILCASCMVACYQPFIRLWAGEDMQLPLEVPVLMVAYFYVLTMGDMRAVYADATGIWWEQRWRAIAESVTNVVLNIIFVQIWGIVGVVIATLISLFLINFVYGSHLVFKYYFGMKYARQYYVDHAKYLVTAMLSSVFSFCVAGVIPDTGIMSLVSKALVAAASSAVVIIVMLRRTEMTPHAIAFFRKVLPDRGLPMLSSRRLHKE